MQKLGLTSMKSLDQFKSLSSSATGISKTFSFSSRSASDSVSIGSFANLKIAAERLVKEQASVKTDLEMANTKLKKSIEHIRALEEKLQIAFNENAKLKVKQKEDEKLWKGLESKFSSTKTLCDQLNETLQLLACQVQDAEKDKESFEGKLSASSTALDSLNQQMNGLTLKLESAEEAIRNREKVLEKLKFEKEEKEKFYRDEQSRNANLIEEKESMIKTFEESIAASRLLTESLNSKLEEVHLELKSKEDEIRRLIINQECLEKEKSETQLHNEIQKRLDLSLLEIKNLEKLVHVLAAQLVELDRQIVTFVDKFDQLNSLYDSCFKLVNQERGLALKRAQKQYNQLHDKFLCAISDKDSLHLVNEDLNSKFVELQKVQESIMAQLSEERLLAKEQIQILESEAESLASKKNATEMLVSKLEEKISSLSESSRSSEIKMQDLLLKISALESENKHNKEELETEIQKKAEQIDMLQKESEKYKKHADSLEKEVDKLHNILEEKEQLIVEYKENETMLEEQKTENQVLLSSVESKLADAKKQYDMMLESKQLELSKHLKELCQRNDQAINDIRNKYEMEKLDLVNKEKEKADKVIEEKERNFEQKLAESKEESRQYLMRIQEEHASLVSHMQQENDRKELSLKDVHSEEMKRSKLQAEDELREKMMLLRNEHEALVKALRCQHEDECQKLQEELDVQKSKEDRQRALLQLQWKVMGDNRQEEQEVNSKKDYSISSIKIREAGARRKSQRALVRRENEEEDSPFTRVAQTPVSKLLKTVENVNTGNVTSIPKHHKKVTHHEYEVETSNGRTITKRKKTRSTVLFEDPRKHKKRTTLKGNNPRGAVELTQVVKGGLHTHASNIGDLFTEGSLNPYADDPYAFD